MQRTVKRILLIAAAFALFVVPAAAIAAAGFTDVADDSVFVADIQWMKDTGVTAGCNPPTNDRFCPSNNVTREQMSAFMHRLATYQVVDAATAIEADHATTADSATNADTLDGKDSTDFVEHTTIATAVGGVAWLPHFSGPSSLTRAISGVSVSGDGSMVLGINAPAELGGIGYGLRSIEVCLNFSGGAYLNEIMIYRTDSATSYPVILDDGTNRSIDGCYLYSVGKSVAKGAGAYLVLSGGGEVRIEGTTMYWSNSADIMGVAATAGAENDA